MSTSTRSSLPQRLPAELTDHIIHLLHGEKLALLALSLVCKSWVTAARYHLFRAIRLERIEFLRPMHPRFLEVDGSRPELLKASGEKPLSRSLRFLELIQAEECTFRNAVQSLSIDQRGSSRRGNCSPSLTEGSWINDVLSITSALLPSLKSLQLEGIDYTLLSSTSKSLLLERFQTVSDFSLTGLRFEKQTDAMGMVTSFPAMQNFTWLTGANTKFSKAGDEPEDGPIDVSGLIPTVRLQGCTIGTEMACSEVGRAVASRSSNLTITSEEKYVSVTQVPSLNDLWAASGERLENLVLNLWHWTANPGSFIDIYDDCQSDNSVHLQLTKNTNLQSIFFQQFRFTHPVVNIPSLLSSVSSSTLSTIVFEVDFGSAEYDDSEEVHPLYLCDYNWEAVDNAIRDSAFAEEVKAVALVVYWAGEASATIENAVRQRMKWCEGRKILVTRFL
jgi:hypothetical protein